MVQISPDEAPHLVLSLILCGATKSRITSVCIWPDSRLLICGTAAGGLEGFPIPDQINCQELKVNSSFTLKKVHKNERVTTVWVSENVVFSAGRDGSISRLQFNEQQQVPGVSGVQRVGDVVSLIESVAPSRSGLLVSGTKGSQFVVYDTGRRAVLLQVLNFSILPIAFLSPVFIARCIVTS